MNVLCDNQPTRLNNVKCAYCNIEFARHIKPQKEHVIGLNFVPKGAHHQQWNLHVNACHTCNQDKSRLENDISAITMLPVGSKAWQPDKTHSDEAKRKGKTISNLTGKPVLQSFESFDVKGKIGSADMTFNVQGPPNFDDQRAFQLAGYQLHGFHFFLTYSKDPEQGGGWPGVFSPMGLCRRSDWGNPMLQGFSDLTEPWQLRLIANTSRGYFRVSIKKDPQNDLWSWALEWNKSYRLFGFYGDEAAIDQKSLCLADAFNAMDWIQISETQRYRAEVPMDEAADRLFHISE